MKINQRVLLIGLGLIIVGTAFAVTAEQQVETVTQLDAASTTEPEITTELVKKAEPVPTKRKTYVIKSQVQASQEQPNVIYITPWQDLDTPIEIDSVNNAVILPSFQPVNPREFRKKVKEYYQHNEQ